MQHVCNIIRGMVTVYMLFSTQGACCTHTYHHPLVGVTTMGASYPFLTAIIVWKGVSDTSKIGHLSLENSHLRVGI